MKIGKLVDARGFFGGFPTQTQATIYEGNRIAAFVTGLNQVTPVLCKKQMIKDCIPNNWEVFLDSVTKRNGHYTFWAVVHRSDIPRNELEGRITL